MFIPKLGNPFNDWKILLKTGTINIIIETIFSLLQSMLVFKRNTG